MLAAESTEILELLERQAAPRSPALSPANSIRRTLILTISLLLLALAWPMLSGRVYVADDLGEFHLPLRAFYARQLAAGEPFDWCSDLYCGFYLTGEGQVGAYHPLHLLLYRTLPLSLAFDLECWISYPVMLAGAYFLLRRWRLSRDAALFGSMTFTFGGFNLLHFVHPNAIATIAHLPWLLLAIDEFVHTKNPSHRCWSWAAIALLTGSQLLLGYPQYAFFSLVVGLGYVAWLAKFKVLEIGRWLAAVAVGFLIGGIQLLPTIDALQHSVRQTAADNLGIYGSLQPLNLLQLVQPYLFTTRVIGQNTHELGIYVGIVPLVLAIWWLGGQSQSRRRITGVLIVAGLIALFWAFGSYGPLGWFESHLPLVNCFRLPVRAMFVFQFSIAVLAAMGFMRLIRQPAVRAPWWLVGVSFLMTAIACWLWPEFLASWPLVVFGPVFTAITVWLIDSAANGRRWALNALVILAALDLGIYGLSASVWNRNESLNAFISETDAPPAEPNGRVALDLASGSEAAPGQNGIRSGDRILLAGWKRVDGYAGLEPARKLDYHEESALRLAGTKWISTSAPRQAVDHQSLNWRKIAQPLARARFVGNAITSDDLAHDIARIHLAIQALIDPSIGPLQIAPSNASKVKITRDRPGELHYSTDSQSQKLLVVSEAFDSGWQGQIDGKSQDVLRVNGDFIGLVVPAGEHEISLEFRPKSLQIGRIVTAFGLGLTMTILLWPLRRRLWHPRPL